jgi:O-methyltransferase/8-demethyl-8-(2,3-dimethoxy-alpha-L-rhamnosyl)tetracenomycin-C 4'-O-methyltransferase
MTYHGVAYSTTETIKNTQYYTDQMIQSQIPGIFVECGVAAGAQIAAMQERLNVFKESRWIYGFDSFEGIPLASEEDDEQPGLPNMPRVKYTDKRELLKSSGVTVCSKEEVRRNLRQWFPNNDEKIILVKGWFQDTLGPYTSVIRQLGGISLLRLDGDLYESTKVSLEQLYPLLNVGGVLIIDDWNLGGCRRACLEYFEKVDVSQVDPPYGSLADGPAYFIKN